MCCVAVSKLCAGGHNDRDDKDEKHSIFKASYTLGLWAVLKLKPFLFVIRLLLRKIRHLIVKFQIYLFLEFSIRICLLFDVLRHSFELHDVGNHDNLDGVIGSMHISRLKQIHARCVTFVRSYIGSRHMNLIIRLFVFMSYMSFFIYFHWMNSK